jgi:hypothetical protein
VQEPQLLEELLVQEPQLLEERLVQEPQLLEERLEEPLQAVVVGLVAVVFARVGVVVRADAAGAGVGRAGRAGRAGTSAGGGPAVSISIVWALLSQVALFSWLRPL